MRTVGSFLGSEASFELAALFVTWVAVALLVIVVGGLHARIRRLEHAGAASRPTPYSPLLGRDLKDLVGTAEIGEPPRVLLFLSSDCSSCARLLSEIESPSWTVRTAIVWTDDNPRSPSPDGTTVLDHGAELSAQLGIRVTPFALVADPAGRVVKAGPVASLRSLGELAVNGFSGREPVLGR